MEGDPRITFQPRPDLGRLVGGDVVEDDMELDVRVGPLDVPQEGEEVGPRVAGPGFGGDPARRHLERGEQARRPVARVVVGVALDLAGLQRQHRRRPVERLDLGLLVEAQDDRPLGRGEVEPDDVADLGLELRVGAELERLGPMGLDADRLPDPPDRRLAHRHPVRQAPGAPMARPVGRRLQGQGDDPIPVLPPVRRRAPGAGLVREPSQAGALVPLAPQEDRHGGHAELGGDPPVRRALGGAQDDPRPLHQPLLRRPRSDERPEDLEIGLADRKDTLLTDESFAPWFGVFSTQTRRKLSWPIVRRVSTSSADSCW